MSHDRLECARQIREHGFRVTPQRLLLLDAVCEGGGHTTFDEIFERMKVKAPGVNRATLYRSLDFLHELGLIYTAEIDGQTVYEIASKSHHHLVCRRCGSVTDIADFHLQELADHLLEEHGFKASLEHLAISGICSECLNGES